MPSVTSIMDQLKAKGSASIHKTYVRHGLPADRMFGVKNSDLKIIAKTIKGQQDLALALYATGNVDAMYLAGIVADGRKMTHDQLQSWADGAAGMPLIYEHTVPWVTVESAYAEKLSAQWIKSREEHIGAAGWRSYAGLAITSPDEDLDLALLEKLLDTVVKEIGKVRNRVRSTMNGFVISVGTYVAPLHEKAKATAVKLGSVAVDVGDTACEIPVATESLAKAVSKGVIGVKRKTIRC